MSENRSTQVSQIIHAPREVVYHAFLEPDALAAWLPPDGMKGEVHTFEPREGGKFRVSLTYLNQSDRPRGKSSEDTDTAEGIFAELIPNEKVVWLTEFNSDDPNFAGKMTTTWLLKDAIGGTEVTVLSENIPQGIRLEDNEMGSRSSLQNLAAFVEHSSEN